MHEIRDLCYPALVWLPPHKLWQCVVFTLLSTSIYSSQGTVLSQVTKIALDSTRQLRSIKVKAMYARFTNTHPFWVQLWNKTNSAALYRLDWQVRITPKYGDGSVEVFNLNSSEHVDISTTHVIAIMNEQLPGPLNGNYHDGSGVVLSHMDRDHVGLPLNQSATFTFDNLRLPYHLPVTLCNDTGCPYELGLPPPTKATTPLVRIEPVQQTTSRLLTEEMMVGLITWNIILTILFLVIILILIIICNDLEKRRKERPRYTDSNYSTPTSYLHLPTPYTRIATPYTVTNPYQDVCALHRRESLNEVAVLGMTEHRRSDSENSFNLYYSEESISKMPSSRF